MTPLQVTIAFLSLASQSPFPYAVRKAHNSGRNHLANVRDYYACESYSLPSQVYANF